MIRATLHRLVGLVCVFVKLCLLPIMAAVEIALLLAVFLTGFIRPRLALRLNDWFCDHLPDRDWYWERPMNVRSAQANAKLSVPAIEPVPATGADGLGSSALLGADVLPERKP